LETAGGVEAEVLAKIPQSNTGVMLENAFL